MVKYPYGPREFVEVPDHIDEAINTPHEHEDPVHLTPLWLVWRIDLGDINNFPALDCVCNSIDVVKTMVAELFASTEGLKRHDVYVERIPVNHRFASSMIDIFTDSSLTTVKKMSERSKKFRYAHDGD